MAKNYLKKGYFFLTLGFFRRGIFFDLHKGIM